MRRNKTSFYAALAPAIERCSQRCAPIPKLQSLTETQTGILQPLVGQSPGSYKILSLLGKVNG